MPVSTEPSTILLELRAGLPLIPALPCASCLFDLGDASGMVGGEPCPLKAALLRRSAVEESNPAERACTGSCAGFAQGYAETGDDWASDFAGCLTRTLS